MLSKALQIAVGNSQESADIAEAIDFDGTNDYLSRSTDLVGNTDGNTFTFSVWVWRGNQNLQYIYNSCSGSTSTRFSVELTGSSGNNAVRVIGKNTSGSTIFSVTSTLVIALQTWTSVIVSGNNNTNVLDIAINDVTERISDAFTSTNSIAFAQSLHNVAQFNGNEMQTRLSNVYLDYTYRDLSVEANRRLFVTADLKPAAGQASLNPILYLPMDDPTQPGLNAGTGGNFTLTGTIARSGRGPNQYNAPYSDLDGTADYLEKTTSFTNSSAVTIAFNINMDSLASAQGVMWNSSGINAIQVDTSGQLKADMYNGGTWLVSATVTSPTLVAGRNYNIIISLDTTDSAKRHIIINGQPATTVTWFKYVSGAINFSSSIYRFGYTGSWYVNGKLGAVWFNTSYIDLSQPANLAKFVTGTGIDAKPVDLGANGELPTGSSPKIYLPMYGNNAGKNYGTGGDFTVNSGPYPGARGPNEYWASAVGNSGYLYRDTPLSGATNTKTLTFFALFKPTSTAVVRSFWQINGVAGGALVGQIQVNGGNGFALYFNNASGVTVLNATVTSPLISSTSTTYAIHASVDLSNTAKRSIYINGVAATVTWSTYTDDTMNFSAQRSGIGAEWGASWNGGLLRGNLGSLYITNAYVDFTQEANRLLFADAFNYSTDIGAAITAGTIPNPLIFMKFDPANKGVNFGTGGNYTNASMSDGGQL